VSSEYRIQINHIQGKDELTLVFETEHGVRQEDVERRVQAMFKSRVGLTIVPNAVPIGVLPRSEKKTSRVQDNRG
jgi:phenylacetate-CoA ligase